MQWLSLLLLHLETEVFWQPWSFLLYFCHHYVISIFVINFSSCNPFLLCCILEKCIFLLKVYHRCNLLWTGLLPLSSAKHQENAQEPQWFIACSVKHDSNVHCGIKTSGLYLEFWGRPLGLNSGNGERTLTVFVLYFLQGTSSFRVWFGCLDFSLVLCSTFFDWANRDLAVPVSSHAVFVQQGGFPYLLFPGMCHPPLCCQQASAAHHKQF